MLFYWLKQKRFSYEKIVMKRPSLTKLSQRLVAVMLLLISLDSFSTSAENVPSAHHANT